MKEPGRPSEQGTEDIIGCRVGRRAGREIVRREDVLTRGAWSGK